MWVSLLFIYLSITFFVLVITEKKNSLARLVMWGRTLKTQLTFLTRGGDTGELLTYYRLLRVTSGLGRIVELSTKSLGARRVKRL